MTRTIARIAIGILMLQAPLTHAQTPAARPHFEVASIKASNPSAPHPGRLGAVPVVTSPGRLTARNARLTELIKGAMPSKTIRFREVRHG
jgi:hypothetical protein